MKRNLLPLFREDSIIGKANPGEWTDLQQPEHLGRLDYGNQKNDESFHARIQSIPSPWARVHLFRNALEEEGHPARALVMSELFDAIEFVWGLRAQRNVKFTTETIVLDDLHQEAEKADAIRVRDFANALLDLVPNYRRGAKTAPITSITLGLINDRPVLMSSPYTLFATAEDAAKWVPGQLFRFADTGKYRALRDRPHEFQAYVAHVVRPQLMAMRTQQSEAEVEWPLITRLLGNWLKDELTRCADVPADKTDEDWAGTASHSGLEPSESVGAFRFFKLGAAELKSRWRLVTRASIKPLVIVPGQFDGSYYANTPRVTLPKDLPRDRKTLPNTTVAGDWVAPELDWFTPKLLLLNTPLDPARVRWLESSSYVVNNPDDRRFAQPRLMLPLSSKFFQYFSVDDALKMLSIETHATGVTAKLRIKVGSPSAPETIEVRKEYREHEIRAQGPELAAWPSFSHPGWRQYLIFRADSLPQMAMWIRLDAFDAEGNALARTESRRTPQAQTVGFKRAPAILELVSKEAAEEQSFGVLFPIFDPAPRLAERGGVVGVDFGTSNTVVAMRESEEKGRVIGFDELTNFLTKPSETMPLLVDAYFFPPAIPARPFGTAIVHTSDLAVIDIEKDPLGLRINVPFSGYVDSSRGAQKERFNKIVGDLKWSTQASARHLAVSFVRNIVSLVVARMLRGGIAPWSVEFRWSYPRAFSDGDIDRMARLWQDALKNVPWDHEAAMLATAKDDVKPADAKLEDAKLEDAKLEDAKLEDAKLEDVNPGPLNLVTARVDESRSVLRHFFQEKEVGLQGAESVILDVGGGTTDIAIYGSGLAPILDSVMLGGRNLTGRPEDAPAGRQGNPFVSAFVRWAEANGLSSAHQDVVRAYLDDGQVHLAFSYLVSTEWFGTGRAAVFAEQPEFHHFQLCVFYFFSALAHYAGLSLRTQDAPRIPIKVIFAGNGSRYLNWLTGLSGVSTSSSNRFHDALGKLMLRAAGAAAEVKPPELKMSADPKREVVLGLVVLKDPKSDHKPITTSVVGEQVTMGVGSRESAPERRSFDAAARLQNQDVILATRVGEIEWTGDRMEIDRFHENIIHICESLAEARGQWGLAAERFARAFESLDRRTIQHLTKTRIEYLATQHEEYRGSIFILEASLVLEHMMDRFFTAAGVPPYAPGVPAAR